jgi:hypothetical protein
MDVRIEWACERSLNVTVGAAGKRTRYQGVMYVRTWIERAFYANLGGIAGETSCPISGQGFFYLWAWRMPTGFVPAFQKEVVEYGGWLVALQF